MTNAKSSNIIYGIFIVFTMLVIGIILAFKGTKERESSSVDYDNSLSVGGYAVKINNCIYFTDTNEIVFTFKYKAMVGSPTNSIPEIYSITYSLKDELNSKQDITTGEELPGATLQIIDEDGNVVEEWVSTDEAHFIEGKLIAGKEYTLRETIAPDGYEIANEIRFTVNEDGSVTEVVMYDEHTPDLETPPTVIIDIPHTGVSADNSAELYLVATAVIMVFGMVIYKKNDKEQRKDDVK